MQQICSICGTFQSVSTRIVREWESQSPLIEWCWHWLSSNKSQTLAHCFVPVETKTKWLMVTYPSTEKSRWKKYLFMQRLSHLVPSLAGMWWVYVKRSVWRARHLSHIVWICKSIGETFASFFVEILSYMIHFSLYIFKIYPHYFPEYLLLQLEW